METVIRVELGKTWVREAEWIQPQECSIHSGIYALKVSHITQAITSERTSDLILGRKLFLL